MSEEEKRKMNILDEEERIREKANMPTSVQACTHARGIPSTKGNNKINLQAMVNGSAEKKIETLKMHSE